jgi:ribonuclease D
MFWTEWIDVNLIQLIDTEMNGVRILVPILFIIQIKSELKRDE